MREAMRERVKRRSFWYLIQGGLMILAGILASMRLMPCTMPLAIKTQPKRTTTVSDDTSG
jgi:hypothetical protein